MHRIETIDDTMWPAIFQIQAQAYPNIAPESVTVLRSKWLTSPKTCLIGLNYKNDLIGYILGHPWTDVLPPPLHHVLQSDHASTNLFLHDLSVAPQARSSGLGSALVKHFIGSARQLGYATVTLMSVQNSAQFWTRFEFQELRGIALPDTYPPEALLMQKFL